MPVNELKLCMGCMSPLLQEGACSVCGYAPDQPPNIEFLSPGSALGKRYLAGKLVASDPEGAWYVGYDKTSKLRVWVREYAPGCISRRNHTDFSIQPLTSSEAQYKALLSDFEDLCHSIRALPQGERVLPLSDIIHANNTVYAIYRYIKTISLESFLERSGGKLSWRHTKKLLMPLYHTMANVHRAGIYHRGLSPKTIHLDQSGTLWVSCFSIAAARTDRSELTAQLFEGYAAPEQYSLNSWQGAWTDVYALGAIAYRALTGKNPPAARDRVYGDDLLEEKTSENDLSAQVIHAINKALAVEVEDRTQSVEVFIADLLATGGSDTAVYTAVPRTPVYEEEPLRRGEEKDPQEELFLLDDDLYEGNAVDLTPVPGAGKGQPEDGADKKKEKPARRRKKEKRARPMLLLILSALAATALLGGVVYWFTNTYLDDLVGLPKAVSTASVQEQTGDASSQNQNADLNKVPEFVGTTRSSVDANGELKDRFIFKYQEKFNVDYAEGVIYDQLPLEGSELPANKLITLFVSKGPERVELPNLVDLPLEDAVRQLEALQISYHVIPRYDQGAEPNVVLATDPAEPGTMVDTGREQVVLYIKMVEDSSGKNASDEADDRERSSKKSSSSKKSGNTNSKKILFPPAEKTGFYNDDGEWVEIIVSNRD